MIFDNIFAYNDSLLPICSDEIINRIEMLLNNPHCGHKEGQTLPVFGEITIKSGPPICSLAPLFNFLDSKHPI